MGLFMKVPPITGVAEIVLSVRDLPGMKRFYVDVLGFSLWEEACYGPGGRLIPGGEPTISFLTITELDTPLGRHCHPQALVLIDHRRHANGRPGHEVTTSTLHHLAFEIPPDSYDLHRERLEQLSLAPQEARFEGIRARSLFFRDPEGNSIELICPDARLIRL